MNVTVTLDELNELRTRAGFFQDLAITLARRVHKDGTVRVTKAEWETAQGWAIKAKALKPGGFVVTLKEPEN